MAIVKRKDNEGIIFYVTNTWNGRQKSERVGRNIRDAQRRDAAMKKEIAAGTYLPPTKRRLMTFGEYAPTWLARRSNKKWSKGENDVVRNHFESRPWLWNKPLVEFRPADTDKLLAEMRAAKNKDGSKRLGDKSISDIISQLKRMFASAIRAEICDRQPVVLEPGTIKRTTKERETYTAAEVVVLLRHHEIPWAVRVLIALWVLGGLRQGEGCGLKWSQLDPDSLPLACLTINEQWDGRTLKTERPRRVPVHPELLAMLRAWAETGFEFYVGRKPTPDDFIVPELDRRGRPKCFGADTSYRRFRSACEAAKVRARTLHSFRHTFVTLCRRGGARADVLERVTHNASGKMIDRYTHFDWAPLCEAVQCLRLESLPELPAPNGTSGSQDPPRLPEAAEKPEESPVCSESNPVVFRPRLSRTGTKDAESDADPKLIQGVIQGSVRQRGEVWRRQLVQTNALRLERLSALAAYDSRDYGRELTVARGLAKVYAGDVEGAVADLAEHAKGAARG